MLKGKFIVFEGIDGSGKSTQSALLYNKLCSMDIKSHKTFEPTNRPIGSLLRKYLKGELSCDKKVLAGLFASDRLDHYLNDEDGIIKQVNNGVTVVCDRNYMSNFAYQADEDEDFVPSLNEKVRGMLKPDAHVFIDVSIDEALDRIAKNRENIDIFENKKALTQIRENYKKYFEIFKNEENIIIIDGNRSEQAISDEVFSKLSHLFDV
ncbi:MAG: dTMP kinase [Clostridia bacterium]